MATCRYPKIETNDLINDESRLWVWTQGQQSLTYRPLSNVLVVCGRDTAREDIEILLFSQFLVFLFFQEVQFQRLAHLNSRRIFRMHVLITGGAGFIGSFIADELLEHGHRVRILDNLSDQVHGPGAKRPVYLNADAELVVGDVRDTNALRHALQGIDAVYHFAAKVGVGQSMYEIASYTATNNMGTAVLLEALSRRPIERLIVASSMSIYGEGLYCGIDGTQCEGTTRDFDKLRAGDWELRDSSGQILIPIPTPESKSPSLASVYALSKYDQEKMCMIVGRAYNIPTVALRLFNVFGPRQSLSNPYTGVLAIFASRYLNGNPPLIFEDGFQQRDFVHVRDVARAARLCLEVPQATGHVFNIGSGNHYTIREIAETMGTVLGADHIEPVITGKYRVGDIRHCFADIGLAGQVLGYKARVSFEEGMEELAEWLSGQVAIDRVAQAGSELASRGLTI